jgi:hypothetical protein
MARTVLVGCWLGGHKLGFPRENLFGGWARKQRITMRTQRIQFCAALLSCVSLLFPHAALASPQINTVTDIALQQGGLLVGQVMGRDGSVRAGEQVVILFGDHEIVRTTTDENGVFAAAGLRGGQYQIASQEGVSLIRAWAPNTAPPAAREGSLLVVGDQVVRGQIANSPGWVINWARNHPWLTTIAALTAIAVPIALASGDDNAS